jgi:DNA modification methylase
MTELFDIPISLKPRDHLTVLPVSVIEIAPSVNGIREESGHDEKSSRTGYSQFPHEIAETCAQLFLRDCNLVVDPFAGWGERGDAMQRNGLKYVGYDLSSEAIKSAKERYGVENIQADSRLVDVPEHDGLITCPPYWNLEAYDGDGLHKAADWHSFLKSYRDILARFADKASNGATYCIASGDWREKGIYYDLTFQTELILKDLGFVPHDKVIISRLTISKVKIMIPQAKRLGYTVKVHETLSVFKKVDSQI